MTTDWLAAELGSPDLRVVDATYFPALPGETRDAAAEYAAGHISGAVFLDLATLADPDTPLPSMLPSEAIFADRLAALGLGGARRIVLYDDAPHHTSARAWWMLRTFGRHNVAILDGGLAKWRAEGRPVSTGTPPIAPALPVAPVQRDDRQVRTLAQVRAIIADASAQLVDARSAARFTGAEPDPRPGTAAGHIPGSLNLRYDALFHPDGTWRSAAELTSAFGRAGVDLSRPIITTCGSGITAAILTFALHLIGREAPLYDGSWSEWGADPHTPKATGTA